MTKDNDFEITPEYLAYAENVLERIVEYERTRYKIVGEPGPWCKKLEDWINKQEDLLDIKLDFADGEHDIEKVAEQAYKIFTGEYECKEIENLDLHKCPPELVDVLK